MKMLAGVWIKASCAAGQDWTRRTPGSSWNALKRLATSWSASMERQRALEEVKVSAAGIRNRLWRHRVELSEVSLRLTLSLVIVLRAPISLDQSSYSTALCERCRVCTDISLCAENGSTEMASSWRVVLKSVFAVADNEPTITPESRAKENPAIQKFSSLMTLFK